jgi:hypothetical protein
MAFATIDSFGSYVTKDHGPIGDIACGGSYSGTFSFDSGAGNPEVFVSFGGDLVHPPNPNLPTYAFATGSDPASLTDPGVAPWLSLGVPVGKDPGPIGLPLYAFNGGAFEIGTLTVAVQTVPLPAALWLFGSGLLGLIGIARRKAG